MGTINPKIPDNFKKYADENPDFPKDILKLIDSLLDIEKSDVFQQKEGLEKVYEQVLSKYQNNSKVVEWSKKFVDNK